jgi:hypothetical protein
MIFAKKFHPPTNINYLTNENVSQTQTYNYKPKSNSNDTSTYKYTQTKIEFIATLCQEQMEQVLSDIFVLSLESGTILLFVWAIFRFSRFISDLVKSSQQSWMLVPFFALTSQNIALYSCK